MGLSCFQIEIVCVLTNWLNRNPRNCRAFWWQMRPRVPTSCLRPWASGTSLKRCVCTWMERHVCCGGGGGGGSFVTNHYGTEAVFPYSVLYKTRNQASKIIISVFVARLDGSVDIVPERSCFAMMIYEGIDSNALLLHTMGRLVWLAISLLREPGLSMKLCIPSI